MPKKSRLVNSKRTDAQTEASRSAQPEVRARSWVRSWTLFLIVAIVAITIAGATWWGSRVMQNAEVRAALAELQPVASAVPPDQRERREALEVADRLLQQFPDSPEAIFGRGTILFRYGLSEEAVKCWKVCLMLVPNLAPAYEYLGLEALQCGRSEEAVEYLRKAIQYDPESGAAGLYLGEALNNLGRMEEAIPVLEQFLKVAPHSPEPYFQLGQAYWYLKSYERAKEYHQLALREDPNFAQAWHGLGQACERLGETDKAREYLSRHADMVNQNRTYQGRTIRGRDEMDVRQSLASAYVTAGKVYLAKGRKREAEQCLAQAATSDPESTLPDSSRFDNRSDNVVRPPRKRDR
ncbi:MAG: tetratricopeptide repeat protein [Pirellulaceae bacterium]